MTKTTWEKTVEQLPVRQQRIGGIRIAKISYDHHNIELDKTGLASASVGALVDQHISEAVQSGSLVSEVSLFFETPEEQELLRNLYQKPL